MKFKILSANNIIKLEDEVNELLKYGWEVINTYGIRTDTNVPIHCVVLVVKKQQSE